MSPVLLGDLQNLLMMSTGPERENMSYKIEFLKKAEKQIAALEKKQQAPIISAIQSLGLDPRPHGAEPVKAMPGHLRIRVGDFRIIYLIRDEVLTVTVVRVGNRREVYKSLG